MAKRPFLPQTLLRLMLLIAVAVPVATLPAPRVGAVEGASVPASIQAEPRAQADAVYPIKLRVISARDEPKAPGGPVLKGAPVTAYKFLISQDNTGDPDPSLFTPGSDCYPYLPDPDPNDAVPPERNPAYPDNCPWPAIREVPGWAPVYTQGTQDDLNETVSISLPAGRYLISVLAEGYRNDGEHFTLPLADPNAPIVVQVHPEPLPPASMTIKVFDDSAMTNGQFDAPAEHGLAGFRVSLNDTMGEITTDMFGNPLCTTYQKDANGDVLLDPDGAPIIETRGRGCYSDANGDIVIPNIGTIRFDVLVIPPDGQTWIQTTTLEGSQGWDTWLMEGGTGMDNEFMVAGEPFPWTIFGFVQPKTPDLGGTGSVTGQIMGGVMASPAQGGLPYQGDKWGGFSGTKPWRPIDKPWLSLNDFQQGDVAVWVGQGNADGTFTIPNVPAGNYFLAYWDTKQHYILDWIQVTVNAGQVTDIGMRTMTNWFTEFYGTVFHDYNENGKRDPGEPGVPNYLVVLKDRDNTEIDRMSITSLTDGAGAYAFEKAYPMGSWMILEAYSDIYRTTGITYQVWNQPEETTVLGAAVDVAVLPVLGQPARLDWGVTFYEPNTNGGIVGTVFYDTMRAEDDARYAGAEPYQPGIPNLTVQLWSAVHCGTNAGATCSADGKYEVNPDGSYKKGALLNESVTESFTQPVNCQARDVDGNPIDFPVLPLPDTTGIAPKRCLEGPAMGTQIGTWPADGGLDFGATLDGNYGLTEGCFGPGGYDPLTGQCADGSAPTALPADDYLVEVVIPNDPVLDRPLFQVTREEDVNMYNGDTFEPAIVPPACAGALHTVDVLGVGADGAGAVYNPGYVDAGGSRFEGQQKPLCDVKLVTVTNGKSIAPIFTLFTDVPIPGKWKGYIINDLVVSTNPFELFVGEMAGLANVPIGIYDWSGRHVHTVSSDRHGVYEVLLPSSETTNAPTPSGILAGMYYIYGNDPGQVGQFNPNYNPQLRSIGATFEIYPGVIVPSDLAPVNNGAWLQSPGSQFHEAARCLLEVTTPQIFAVSRPYLPGPGTLTIYGQGFGSSRGAGRVLLGNLPLPTTRWTDTEIDVRVNAALASALQGTNQLLVIDRDGEVSPYGISMHIRGPNYQPAVYEVGPGKQFDSTGWNGSTAGPGPIQRAIDAAAQAGGPALVVVYPGAPGDWNPYGSYFENVVLHARVQLQGVGPGGTRADGTSVAGTHIDGRAVGGDTAYSTWWRQWVTGPLWNNGQGWDGSLADADGLPIVGEGSVFTVLAKDGEFTSGPYRAMIDGFTIEGGDQQGFPANVNAIDGTPTGQPANVTIQGGGVYVNGYARSLQISNNVIRSNGGSYGGGIRIGTPHVPGALADAQNDNIRIAYNRILANGGTNLAGGIGLFNGAEAYEVDHNDICGNYSVEYGGGISHYGYNPNSSIHHNRIYFNRSNDEGGGIMIAGELPANPSTLSPGAGPVEIHSNLLQGNLANDDGGGLRFLMAGNFTYNVYNNMIVNNVSTHEGGGISLWDAPKVRVYNNTIMKNLTTATAMTSNGLPAPAGLATVRNSDLLQATLPAGSPIFSDPILFNNIFWDNRAATRTMEGLTGIGMAGDPNPIHAWDVGVADGVGTLNPAYSLFTTPVDGTGNLDGSNPLVAQEYDLSVSVWYWRGNMNFLWTEVVAVEAPPTATGDYHITNGSPVLGQGTRTWLGVSAPSFDYDGQQRPIPAGITQRPDIGADERR